MSQHSIKSFSAALFKKPFYLAFINIFILFKRPLDVLVRYVLEVGDYPKRFLIRTPLGLQSVTAFSHPDLITLIECFGKLDYRAPKNTSVVVDFGSNIGISALYFLTRNPDAKVYLFEPVPRNIERLKENLKGFENRYELKECAVGVEEGQLDFACDETGRHGGLIEGGAPYFAEWDPEKIKSSDRLFTCFSRFLVSSGLPSFYSTLSETVWRRHTPFDFDSALRWGRRRQTGNE